MTYKIDGQWNCPQCSKEIKGDQKNDIAERIGRECQIEFHCEHCFESLTADTSDCNKAGYLDIFEDWVYD